ncbi:MAG TPA: IclR family transcriptional regulator [Burkholderiaceae bacterium]
MLSVLDLFSSEHTTMTAEQIAESLGLTRTTCYRYTRELGHAGLLVSDGGLFMLGPRIIELDHRIIQSDPLLNAGRPIVCALADSLGATGLLTTCYDDRIINVFEHGATTTRLPVSFGRGTTMPLFRSSTSKAILASMSRSRLKRLWKEHQDEADCQAIGRDWLSFWKALQVIKRQGLCVSTGELDAGMSGISSPILFGTGDVAGCVSLVFPAEDFKVYAPELLGARLRAAAGQISRALALAVGEPPGRPVQQEPVVEGRRRRAAGPDTGSSKAGKVAALRS